MKSKPLIAHGHNKLILLGEHAAVYGYPSMGITLSTGITITYAPQAHSIPFATPFAGLASTHQHLIKQCLIRFEDHFEPAELDLNSLFFTHDSPISLGFGSSAALCVALSKLIYQKKYGEKDIKTLWKAAHEMEYIFHGTPSGIDTGLSIHHGLTAFHKGDDLPIVEKLPPFPFSILSGYVPRLSNTKALVQQVATDMHHGEKNTLRSISRLGELAETGIQLLRNNTQPFGENTDHLDHFHTIIQQAQQELESLHLVSPLSTLVIQKALNLGARSGKMSGAGGGGAFFLLLDPDTDPRSITMPLNQTFKNEGLHLLVNSILK